MGKTHLKPELKAAMERQTLLPHGFQQNESKQATRSAIENSVALLRRHRPDSWHLVLVAAYTGFNFSRGVTQLWQYVDETVPGKDEKVKMGAEMREGIVKCVPFIGIPRVLTSLRALHRAQSPEVGEASSALLKPLRDDVDTDAELMMSRGQALWDDVYAPPSLSKKLSNNIASFHPNLARLIVQSSYGHAMSPTEIVSREDTSAIAVTVLKVEEDVLDQLTSHVFGLLKGGGDQEYCLAIIAVVDGLRNGTLSRSKPNL